MIDEKQKALVDYLLSICGSRNSLISKLTHILNISQSLAYSKLNGSSILNLNQAIKICNAFNLSFDEFYLNNQKAISFNYDSLLAQPQKLTSYVTSLVHILPQRPNPKTSLYYIADGIPIFHYFNYKALIYFKLWLWSQSVWKLKAYTNQPFSINKMDFLEPELWKACQACFKAYNSTPTNEIISSASFNYTLNQIRYYRELNYIENPSDCTRLYNQITSLLANLENMAAQGFKKELNAGSNIRSSFNLYTNNAIQTNNIILRDDSHSRQVFQAVDFPNFMSSSNQYFCTSMLHWFKKIVAHCTPISNTSYKARTNFFKHLNQKLETRKNG